MENVKFGNTGLCVSPLTLGTWGIGGAGWDDYPEDVRMDAINAALENGINFIDTAPAYNAGEAERQIGRALEKAGNRDRVVIATKCGNRFINGQYVRSGKPENIFAECEDSLRNLRTDHIDVMLVHWPDPSVPFEETFGALSQLKSEGKILHIGVSNFSKEQILEARKTVDIEVLQLQFSMFNHDNEEVLKWAHSQGIGTMAYGVLCGGLLTGRYRKVETYEAADSRNRFYGKFFTEPFFSKAMKMLDAMQPAAERHNADLSEIALNWARQKEYIDTCIAGAQKRERIEKNARSFQWKLTDEDMAELDDAINRIILSAPV